MRLSSLRRLITINRVLIKHGLDEILLHIPIFRPLRVMYYIAPWNYKSKDNKAPIEVRIRRALEDLGPVFIKFGQMLSTRNDLLPPHINKELSKLQDNVPPFSSIESVALIEKALGKPVSETFKSFETEPMASASIAQVHSAILDDGKDVIVKVLRPDILPIIQQDVGLLFLIAKLVQRYWKEARRLRPVDVVQEYETTIIDELDLIREAANGSQLRRNFEGSSELYIPEIYWDYCRDNVLVMERVYGIPVAQMDTLNAQNVNMKRLGELGVEVFFTQVFKHNFFHADMHPGNIFVDATNPQQPHYIAIDFGIVGTLTPDDQRYLAENLHAFFNRDYKRVAELHIESGWIPSTTRINDFESAIRTVCEPIFNRPLKEISFGFFLLRLFQTARRFDMEVQPQLVLLQKTLLNIEGLGRQLYPDLDLWNTAKPFLQRWMDEQVGIRSLLNGAKDNLPKFIEQLPQMPTMINDVVKQIHDQNKQRADFYQQQNRQLELAKVNTQKNILAVLAGACLISGTLLLSLNVDKSTFNITISITLGLSGLFLGAKAYFK